MKNKEHFYKHYIAGVANLFWVKCQIVSVKVLKKSLSAQSRKYQQIVHTNYYNIITYY